MIRLSSKTKAFLAFLKLIRSTAKITYRRWSNPREDDREEEETIEDTQHDDEQVHPKVVQSEQRGWSKGQNHDTQELSWGDSYHNGASHVIHGLHGSFLSITCLSHEVHSDMVAELDTETNRCDEIDNQNCIHLNWIASHDNVEHPANAHQLEENHENAERDNQGDSQTCKNLHGNYDSSDRHKNILEQNTSDICVLIIVDVVEWITESCGRFTLFFLGFENLWLC